MQLTYRGLAELPTQTGSLKQWCCRGVNTPLDRKSYTPSVDKCPYTSGNQGGAISPFLKAWFSLTKAGMCHRRYMTRWYCLAEIFKSCSTAYWFLQPRRISSHDIDTEMLRIESSFGHCLNSKHGYWQCKRYAVLCNVWVLSTQINLFCTTYISDFRFQILQSL